MNHEQVANALKWATTIMGVIVLLPIIGLLQTVSIVSYFITEGGA